MRSPGSRILLSFEGRELGDLGRKISHTTERLVWRSSSRLSHRMRAEAQRYLCGHDDLRIGQISDRLNRSLRLSLFDALRLIGIVCEKLNEEIQEEVDSAGFV